MQIVFDRHGRIVALVANEAAADALVQRVRADRGVSYDYDDADTEPEFQTSGPL